MEVDADIAGGVELLSPSDIAPAADMLLEDVPSVSLRREELRKDCLQRFADVNEEYGKMIGYSKTCRSCREDGMVVGLSGMFGRWARRCYNISNGIGGLPVVVAMFTRHVRGNFLASGKCLRASRNSPRFTWTADFVRPFVLAVRRCLLTPFRLVIPCRCSSSWDCLST